MAPVYTVINCISNVWLEKEQNEQQHHKQSDKRGCSASTERTRTRKEQEPIFIPKYGAVSRAAEYGQFKLWHSNSTINFLTKATSGFF